VYLCICIDYIGKNNDDASTACKKVRGRHPQPRPTKFVLSSETHISVIFCSKVRHYKKRPAEKKEQKNSETSIQ